MIGLLSSAEPTGLGFRSFHVAASPLAQGSGRLAQQNGSENGPALETQISAVPGFFLPALSYLFILRLAESPTE